MKKINLVIPCHNVQNEIKLFVEDANRNLPSKKYNFTYTFVNDGSIDNTKQTIINYIAQYDYIRLVDLTKSFGYNSAIIAGFDYSLNYDATILYDIELHLSFSHILQMINLWEKGVKFVKTYRSNIEESSKQKIKTRFYNAVSQADSLNINQYNLNVQLMDRQVIKEIVKLREYDPYFQGLSDYVGFTSIDLPITIEANSYLLNHEESQDLYQRKSVSGITTYSEGLFKLVSKLAYLLALICLIFIPISILITLFATTIVFGLGLIICFILFALSAIFLMFGVLFYFIGHILVEQKNRPLYVVDSVYTR